MSRHRSPSQQRIVAAASELFASQGFDLTTTKQIAAQARVNEATVFRNFGSKHDLLLAVVTESELFAGLPEAFGLPAGRVGSLAEAVESYCRTRLGTLDRLSELLRAFVGEAGQYSVDRQQGLGRELQQGTQAAARYFADYIEEGQSEPPVSPAKLAALLDSLLLGYLVTEPIDELRELWSDREDFLQSLVRVFAPGATSDGPEEVGRFEPPGTESSPPSLRVADLPADLVRSILQGAKQAGSLQYAVIYLLFGAGLLPEEIVGLERSQYIPMSRQHLVQLNRGAVRQVAPNQWIMGKRYGSPNNNPLGQWLKGRKDESPALFITDGGRPLALSGLLELWQEVTATLRTPDNLQPRIEQARQTWCVEMLMKGVSPADLSILSGSTLEQLQPYIGRAREKAALERAIQLDRP